MTWKKQCGQEDTYLSSRLFKRKTGEDSSGNDVLGHSKDKIGGRVSLKEVLVE